MSTLLAGDTVTVPVETPVVTHGRVVPACAPVEGRDAGSTGVIHGMQFAQPMLVLGVEGGAVSIDACSSIRRRDSDGEAGDDEAKGSDHACKVLLLQGFAPPLGAPTRGAHPTRRVERGQRNPRRFPQTGLAPC